LSLRGKKGGRMIGWGALIGGKGREGVCDLPQRGKQSRKARLTGVVRDLDRKTKLTKLIRNDGELEVQGAASRRKARHFGRGGGRKGFG